MRIKLLVFVLTLIMIPLVFEGQIRGQSLIRVPPDLRFTEKPVAILPVRNLRGVSVDNLFSSTAPVETTTVTKSQLNLIEKAQLSLIQDPRFHAITPDEIRGVFALESSHSTAISLVRERFYLGLDLYDALRLKEAIHHLEEARKYASDIYLEVLEPNFLSRIYFVLGMAYLEEGMKGQAHVSFKKMFLLQPQKRIRKGYYSEDTEEALRAALIDTLAAENVLWSIEAPQLNALMKKIGAAQAIQFIESDDNIAWLATDGIRTWRDREPMEGQDHDEATSRLISRWISCLDGLVAKAKIDNFKPEFRLDSNLIHGTFLKHPTRQMSQQVGFSTNGTFRFNRYLDGSVKLGFLSLLQDPLKDLRGDVMGARATFSTGFSFRSSPFMWFVRSGIDFLYLDPFTVLNNPDCKFFGEQSDRCPTGNIAASDESILAGLAFFVGGAIDLSDEIYISLHSGISLFRNLVEQDTAFNYLLTNELGLGYRF